MERSRGAGVVAVFLYEPEILGQPEWSPSHTAFQRECLTDLEPALARLGIVLVTRRGEAVAMLEGLRRETGFVELFAHEETGSGVSYDRDRRVRRWAREAGVRFVELPQSGVVRRLASRNGWNRLWEARMQSPQRWCGRWLETGQLTACGGCRLPACWGRVISASRPIFLTASRAVSGGPPRCLTTFSATAGGSILVGSPRRSPRRPPVRGCRPISPSARCRFGGSGRPARRGGWR